MTNWFPIVGANKDCIRIMCIRCLPFTKHFLSYPHRDFVRMSACDREFFMQNSGDSKWHWKRKKLYCMCKKKNYSFLKVSEYYSNTWVTPNVRDIPNNEFFVQWCVIIVLRCVITSKLLFHISHKIFFQKTIVFFFAIRLMWW